MKTVGKIVACLTAACLLLGMMTALKINPDALSEDTVLVDSASADYDEQALFEELFDPDSVVEIAIQISKEQLANIQKDYEYYRQFDAKSTTYRIADSVTFTVNGKKYVIQDVGVRMKGAKSRCNFYNDVLGIYNLLHLRLSFNQTFDDTFRYKLDTRVWASEEEFQQRKKRTFATMKAMELKWNTTADSTYVRNGYVHEVFRAYGIPAQQCHLAALSMGGSKMGVYRMFEPVDEGFIHRYFSEEDWGGDLYKVKGTETQLPTYQLNNTYGIPKKQKAEYYNFNLKTNEDTSTHESLTHMLEVINCPDATREDIESVIDIEQLTLFTAINFAMGSMDDMRSNYNNHYVYFRKSDGKAVFIPYDCEIVLGDLYSWNPPGNGMTEISPYYDGSMYSDLGQMNPVIRQIVLEGGWYVDRYTADLREVAGGKWLDAATFEKLYEPVAANYSDKVISPYNYMSTLHMDTAFSLEARNGNMSVADFMEKMRKNIMENTVEPAAQDGEERTDV